MRLCAPPTPCRVGCIHCCRRDKKKKEKKKQAISCFTWCGYPISYTKHVAKQMYANMLPFLVDVLFLAEPSQIQSKNSLMKYDILGAMTCICCFLESGGLLERVILEHIFAISFPPRWRQLKFSILHTSICPPCCISE